MRGRRCAVQLGARPCSLAECLTALGSRGGRVGGHLGTLVTTPDAGALGSEILMPEMASLRVAAFEEGGKFIGHRIIPIHVIRSGYHHMCLRSESNMALTMPSVFVYVEVKDYIPDAWAELTHALSNPIKAFKAHDKLSIKLNKGSAADEKSSSPQSNGVGGSGRVSVKVAQNGPRGSSGAGKVDDVKEATEPETTNQDELQKQKSFLKLQKKQEKELKELERKGQKRQEEIIQRYSGAFADLHTQINKKPSRKCQKKKSPEDDYGSIWGAGEIPGKPDPKIVELKEKMEQELTRASEEFYESIWKKKEQHSAEQTSKLLELAQERQALELKFLKESTDSDTKLMKKKLETKRVERLEAISKNTMDKASQERLKKEVSNSHIQEVVQVLQMVSDKWNNHQQKLEEKQNDGLQKIKEKGEQAQKDLQREYQDKLKTIEGEVAEQIHNCMAPWFPAEAKSLKKEAINCANMWEFLFTRHEKVDPSAETSQSEAKTEEEPTKEAEGESLPNDSASKDPSEVANPQNDSTSSDGAAQGPPSGPEEETTNVVAKIPSEETST